MPLSIPQEQRTKRYSIAVTPAGHANIKTVAKELGVTMDTLLCWMMEGVKPEDYLEMVKTLYPRPRNTTVSDIAREAAHLSKADRRRLAALLIGDGEQE